MQTNINTGFSYQLRATPGIFQNRKMPITQLDYEKYLTISKGLSKKSIKTYLQRFKIVNKWLADSNLELSRQSVEDFLFHKTVQKCSNSTINTYIQAINHIIGCYKFHDQEINIAEKIKGLPKKNPVIIPLSIEESNKLLVTSLSYKDRNGVDCSSLDFKYLTLTEFITYTACRYDEAASLRVNQLDIDNKRALLTDTKNKENRFLFFNGPVVEHLLILINGKKPNDLVFTNSKNGKMHSGDFGNNLKRRAIKAGITKHINPHLLRHTYATIYYNYTHDIAMVATILGHKDIQTTYETYVHLDTEGIQRATNRHPLISQYVPVKEALENHKLAIDNLRIADDKRLKYDVSISNNELIIKIKAIDG